jgi:hypothetical protein
MDKGRSRRRDLAMKRRDGVVDATDAGRAADDAAVAVVGR